MGESLTVGSVAGIFCSCLTVLLIRSSVAVTTVTACRFARRDWHSIVTETASELAGSVSSKVGAEVLHLSSRGGSSASFRSTWPVVVEADCEEVVKGLVPPASSMLGGVAVLPFLRGFSDAETFIRF